MKKRNPTTKKAQRGASHAGFHFMHLYQCCPMKFFIRHVLRIDTIYIAAPLVTGSAFHEGKAIWYNTRSETKAKRKVEIEIEKHEDDYEYADQYERDLIRFPILLEKWIDEYGRRDLEDFEILGVEKELKVEVPGTNGFEMTMRPDLVYRDKQDKRLYVHDTKTSSFSKKITEMSVYYGDQATAYLWAVKENYDERPEALIADIAYWNKNARGEDNISCYRGELVIRSDSQIREFQEEVASIFNEISQKVAAWRSGKFSKTELFHRNTYYCNSYAKPCEYADICRTNIEEKKRVPPGFIRVPNSKKETIASFVNDSITES